MSWNYRVIRLLPPDRPYVGDELTFAICEVYYDDEDNDKITGYSDPIPVQSDSVDGLAHEIARFQQALTQPVIDESEICGDKIRAQKDGAEQRLHLEKVK